MTSKMIHQIERYTTDGGSGCYLEARHEVYLEKVAGLCRSMRRNGWTGPEAVIDGDTVIDGHHRLTAASWLRMAPETVELADMLDDADVGQDAIDAADGSAEELVKLLPQAVREYYGLWV